MFWQSRREANALRRKLVHSEERWPLCRLRRQEPTEGVLSRPKPLPANQLRCCTDRLTPLQYGKHYTYAPYARPYGISLYFFFRFYSN